MRDKIVRAHPIISLSTHVRVVHVYIIIIKCFIDIDSYSYIIF